MSINISVLPLATILTLAITACSKTPSAISPPDPLDSFKAIVEKCHAAIVESDKIRPGKTGGFVRTAITPGPKSFDVKKTDSLVSPYLAYIDLNFIDQSVAAPTEEAARAWAGGSVSIVKHWRLVYAMQGGKWKLQDELYSFALPSANITEGTPEKMRVGALAESLSAAVACMPG